jgi:hypothetical protein
VADEIREQNDLEDLQLCADTLKHLRKTGGSRAKFELQASSSGVSPDQVTWMTNDLKFVDVLKRAFEKLKDIPKLK